ncbi:MAG: thioredoxin family protein [Flavobacteriaceae bacterium]|nr:thioredoxin family protein [Flavobacteriaceae bacterium]
MKKTFLFILILQSFIGFSQSESECDKILSQEIKLDFTKKTDLDILNSTFSKLQDCGLEKIDIETFVKGPILGALLIGLTKENGGEITYQNLFDKIMEFKKTPEYAKTIEIVKLSTELLERKMVIKNWENDKALLEKLNTPSNTVDEIHLLVLNNSNPNKTYKELFQDLKNKNPRETKAKNITKKEYNGIFKNAGNVSYNDLLNKSIQYKKPLLLYFTGYACVNCRKMENYVLSKPSIEERLKNEFYFVNLYVDDKKSLPENERTESKINGKLIKYVGQKHSELQINKFKNNYQPYFVIIDKNGTKVSDQGYTKDIELFDEFLNRAE